MECGDMDYLMFGYLGLKDTRALMSVRPSLKFYRDLQQ